MPVCIGIYELGTCVCEDVYVHERDLERKGEEEGRDNLLGSSGIKGVTVKGSLDGLCEMVTVIITAADIYVTLTVCHAAPCPLYILTSCDPHNQFRR